jgi:hypothetical protein
MVDREPNCYAELKGWFIIREAFNTLPYWAKTIRAHNKE